MCSNSSGCSADVTFSCFQDRIRSFTCSPRLKCSVPGGGCSEFTLTFYQNTFKITQNNAQILKYAYNYCKCTSMLFAELVRAG